MQIYHNFIGKQSDEKKVAYRIKSNFHRRRNLRNVARGGLSAVLRKI